MALDTATRRGSLIYRLLPFPSGEITQEARQDLIGLFATPLIQINPWIDEPGISTSWGDQSNATTSWSDIPNSTTTWS